MNDAWDRDGDPSLLFKNLAKDSSPDGVTLLHCMDARERNI